MRPRASKKDHHIKVRPVEKINYLLELEGTDKDMHDWKEFSRKMSKYAQVIQTIDALFNFEKSSLQLSFAEYIYIYIQLIKFD